MTRTLAVLLTAACLASTGMARAARNDAAAEKLGWKVSLQCYTFRTLTFFETVDRAQTLGVKYLEVYPGQTLKPGSKAKTGPGLTDAETAEMLAKVRQAGLKIVAFGVAGIPADEAAARKHFAWAKKMGIEVLVTETKPTPLIDKLSKEYGIRIALHNHPKPSHYWNPDTVLEEVKGCNPLIGSCADTGHWMRSGLVPLECLKKLEGRVVHMHFKDVAPGGKGFQDVPWGTGPCNARGMLMELKRQGFNGYMSIEYEHGTVEELMKNIAACLEFLDKTAGEAAGPGGGARPMAG